MGEVPEDHKEPMRAWARRLGEQLAAVGCLLVPAFDFTLAFSDTEAEALAQAEHEHLSAQASPGSGTGWYCCSHPHG